MHYISRPVGVEAAQYTGDAVSIRKWREGHAFIHCSPFGKTGGIIIGSLTEPGSLSVKIGQWIVRDSRNNFSGFTDEEFKEKYAPAGD
jgi:hypothetical protein